MNSLFYIINYILNYIIFSFSLFRYYFIDKQIICYFFWRHDWFFSPNISKFVFWLAVSVQDTPIDII